MKGLAVDLASQSIVNYAPNPGSEVRPLGADGGGTATITQATDRFLFGTKATRFVWVSGQRGLGLTKGAAPFTSGFLPLDPGVYRVTWWVYPESGQLPSWVATREDFGNNRPLGGPTTLGQWSRCSATFTVLASEGGVRIYNLNTAASSYVVDGITITKGTTDYPFVDGNLATHGWRWRGAAEDSQSVGYPYTLESIVGAPLASLAAPGTIIGTTDPMKGRTLATVVDVVDLNSDFHIFASTGSSAAGLIGLRTRGQSGTDFGLFCQWPTGTQNMGRTLTGIRTVGRHVLVSRVTDGITEAAAVGDQLAEVSAAVAGGQGFTGNVLLFASSNTSQIVRQAYMWDRDLGAEGARRAQAWLARRYGAPIPAGY